VNRPVAWLYTLRGMKSFSPTRLEHCIALGWHEQPLYAEPDTSQTAKNRGRHYDIIQEALETYRDFMLDDDYNSQQCLDAIMKRMKERVEMSGTPTAISPSHSETP
jgi:hypothetical protein